MNRLGEERAEFKLTGLLTEFRMVITGGDFENTQRKACGHDSLKLHEVSEVAGRLIDEFDRTFRKEYK